MANGRMTDAEFNKSCEPKWYCASCDARFVHCFEFYRGANGQLLHEEADGTACCGPVLPIEEEPAP